MSNVTFACPECSGLLRASFETAAVDVDCATCGKTRSIRQPDLTDGYLKKCLVCPSTELFLRKDFPQRLGVTIVVIGFIASSVFWARYQPMAAFAVLLLTALIDIVLYLTMGDVLECYRCHAQYRGLSSWKDYEQFDLEAYEKHRQQAIRLRDAKRTAQ